MIEDLPAWVLIVRYAAGFVCAASAAALGLGVVIVTLWLFARGVASWVRGVFGFTAGAQRRRDSKAGLKLLGARLNHSASLRLCGEKKEEGTGDE